MTFGAKIVVWLLWVTLVGCCGAFSALSFDYTTWEPLVRFACAFASLWAAVMLNGMPTIPSR